MYGRRAGTRLNLPNAQKPPSAPHISSTTCMQLNSTRTLANAPTATTGASDHVKSHPMPAEQEEARSASALQPKRVRRDPAAGRHVSSNCALRGNDGVVDASLVLLVEIRLSSRPCSPLSILELRERFPRIRAIASARGNPSLPYHANQFLDHHVYRRIGQAEALPDRFRAMVERVFRVPTRSVRRSPES